MGRVPWAHAGAVTAASSDNTAMTLMDHVLTFIFGIFFSAFMAWVFSVFAWVDRLWFRFNFRIGSTNPWRHWLIWQTIGLVTVAVFLPVFLLPPFIFCIVKLIQTWRTCNWRACRPKGMYSPGTPGYDLQRPNGEWITSD